MSANLPSPITRMTQAMLVLGLCAALVVVFVNLRESRPMQLIESQLLDWRFLLRGPIPADRNIQLVIVDNRRNPAVESPTDLFRIADTVSFLTANGARTIVLDPALLPIESIAAERDHGGAEAALAKSLQRAANVVIPYVFSFAPSAAERTPLPETVRKTASTIQRAQDKASLIVPFQPTGFQVPVGQLLAATTPGHVISIDEDSRSRRYAYPVLAYRNAFYPSLALQAARLYFGMEPSSIAVSLPGGLQLGSNYIPTDSRLRLAVNYRGPEGTYIRHSLKDLLAGKSPGSIFKDKLVVIGLAPVDGSEKLAVPFGAGLSTAEFQATVIDNLLHADPLDRSQQVVVLDILLLGLIGLAFGLVAVAKRVAIVVTLAIIGGALVSAVNIGAFILLNLWLNLTFPLLAIILCTLVLLMTKKVSARRLKAIQAAAKSDDANQFSIPWTFDRVAKARILGSDPDEDTEEVENDSSPLDDVDTADTENARPPEAKPVPTANESKTTDAKEAVKPEITVTPEEAEPPEELEDDNAAAKADADVTPDLTLPVGAAGDDTVDAENEDHKDVDDDKEAEDEPIFFLPPASDVMPEPPKPEQAPAEQTHSEPLLLPVRQGKKPSPQFPMTDTVPKQKKSPKLSPTEAVETPPEKPAMAENEPETAGKAPDEAARTDNIFPVAVLYINMNRLRTLGNGLGPTRAAQFLHAVNQLVDKTVTKHHGFLEKFGESGVMALFGLPDATAQDAENALKCGRELAISLSEWSNHQAPPNDGEVKFCIGLHYGPVIIEPSGSADAPELSLDGEAIRLASRLEKSTAAAGAAVVASAALIDEVKRLEDTDAVLEDLLEMPGQRIPGRPEPMTLWRWPGLTDD